MGADIPAEQRPSPKPLGVGHVDHEARTLAAGQEMVFGTGSVNDRQNKLPWILVACAAVTLAVFAALAVTGVFTDNHDDGGPTESAVIDEGRGEEEPVIASADPELREPQPEPELAVVAPDPFVHDTINAARLMLGTALPDTHAIRFEGTAGARVSIAGQTVGTTPFEAVVPMVDREITVRYERDRHEARDETISLTDEVVRVDLREEQRERPDRHQEQEEPTIPPFGGVEVRPHPR